MDFDAMLVKHLMSLGSVVMNAADLEQVSGALLLKIGELDNPSGRRLVASLSLSRRLEELEQVVKEQRPRSRELLAAVDQARKLVRRRNNAVHATWVFHDPEANAATRLRADRSIGGFRRRLVTAAQLEGLASELQDAWVRLLSASGEGIQLGVVVDDDLE